MGTNAIQFLKFSPVCNMLYVIRRISAQQFIAHYDDQCPVFSHSESVKVNQIGTDSIIFCMLASVLRKWHNTLGYLGMARISVLYI